MTDRPAVAVLAQLVELQELDIQLDAIKTAQSDLPTQREAARTRLEAAQASVAETRQALETLELEQRRVEAQLKDAEALTTRLEGQTGNVSSNQAYTVLLREIDHAKEQASAREDEILDMMERIDGARSQSASAASELTSVEDAMESEEQMRAKQEEQLDQERTRLSEGRDARCADIAPNVLKQYEQIGRRHSVRISRMEKRVCAGCRIAIPAQQASNVRAAKELVTCLQCDRILLTEALADEVDALSRAGE